MIKRLFHFVILMCLCGAAWGLTPSDWILGKWRVVKIMDYAPVGMLTDEQAKAVIGSYISIEERRITFQGKAGFYPRLSISRRNAFDCFLNGYRMDPKNLGLPEEVTEILIDYNSGITGFYAVYILNRDAMIFFWKGVFYKAIRVK